GSSRWSATRWPGLGFVPSVVTCTAARPPATRRTEIQSPSALGPIRMLISALTRSRSTAPVHGIDARRKDGWMPSDSADVTVAPGADGVATVTIHRPPNNFFDTALIAAIADAFEALDDDPGCRAIV